MVDDEKQSEDVYCDRRFRTDPSGDRRLTVGLLSFVVIGAEAWSDKLTRLGVEIEEYPRRTYANDDEAFAEVDRQMREIRDAINRRIAPLLRWQPWQNLHEARFDVDDAHPLRRWRLVARAEGYAVEWGRRGYLGSASVQTLEANQRAAEQELRDLGVVFRTECG